MTTPTIKDLAYSYRTEPTLCIVGDKLSYHQFLWRLYSFLSQYAKPKYHISDNDTQDYSLSFVTDDLFAEVNAQLTSYGVELILLGGNLYLTKEPYTQV